MGKAYDAVQRYIDSMMAKDLDAVLDCFHDDVVYHYHVGTRPFEGKDFLKKGITMLWPHQAASRWRIVNYLEDDDKIIFEGIAASEVTLTDTPSGTKISYGDGDAIQLSVASLTEADIIFT